MTLQDTYLSRKIHLTVFYTFILHYPQNCANFYSFFECYFMTLNCNANSINRVSFILVSIIISIALHALSNLGCSFPCFKIALWGVYSGFHGNYDIKLQLGRRRSGTIAVWILQTPNSFSYSKCNTCHARLTCTRIRM